MPRPTLAAAGLALAAAWLTPHASAQEEAGTFADRLNRMDAQVQLLRKKLELDQALSLSAGTSLGSLPRIVAVFGFEQQLQARLMLPGGMVATYREGDVIRGAMKVVAITPRSVLVSVQSGRKTSALPLEFISAGREGQGGGPVPLPAGMPAGPLPPELLPLPPAVGSPLPPSPRAGIPMAPPGAPARLAAPVTAAPAAPVAATPATPAQPARQLFAR